MPIRLDGMVPMPIVTNENPWDSALAVTTKCGTPWCPQEDVTGLFKW